MTTTDPPTTGRITTGRLTASERIIAEVTSWPGVVAGPGRLDKFAFTVGGQALGHLHGDGAAHFTFPKAIWAQLRAEGRITEHPVFPGELGPGERPIHSEADVRDVIALLRLNYDRATG